MPAIGGGKGAHEVNLVVCGCWKEATIPGNCRGMESEKMKQLRDKREATEEGSQSVSLFGPSGKRSSV